MRVCEGHGRERGEIEREGEEDEGVSERGREMSERGKVSERESE